MAGKGKPTFDCFAAQKNTRRLGSNNALTLEARPE